MTINGKQVTRRFTPWYCKYKDTTGKGHNLAIKIKGILLALCHFDNFKRADAFA